MVFFVVEMLLENSLSCFPMFWRLITGNEKAEEVQGRDKWHPRFFFVLSKSKMLHVSLLKILLDYQNTHKVFIFLYIVLAFNFGSHIGLYWLVLYSEIFNIGIGNLRPGPEI